MEVEKLIDRMVLTIEETEGRGSIYLSDEGKPVMRGGRAFDLLTRDSAAVGRLDFTQHRQAAYVIEYPFRPSPASLRDMVMERRATGERIVYDEGRWDSDPRIAEAAGPCVTEDWQLEALLNERIAA